MAVNLLYGVYERRLQRALRYAPIPRHIAVILDGNRRWARAVGSAPSVGHKAGADRIGEFLEWSEELGVEVVTLWMLSTDNLMRDEDELQQLLEIIIGSVQSLARRQRWRLSLVGDLDLLPADAAERLRQAVSTTEFLDTMQVNIAVSYGGRRELVDAVRELLVEAEAAGKTLGQVAGELSDEDITAHLYTRGQPDPDLVIRTSGEQRLSGFMMWQAAHSEFYFCEAYWPDFRRVDFLRALRAYSQRERRRGR
ncbi:isoprenyl transferase [Actinomyces sp. F1_1611]